MTPLEIKREDLPHSQREGHELALCALSSPGGGRLSPDLTHLAPVSAPRPDRPFIQILNKHLLPDLARGPHRGKHHRTLTVYMGRPAITWAVRATKQNPRDPTPNRQKPSALLVHKARAPWPRNAGPGSRLHRAPFLKARQIWTSPSPVRTSPLLNSTDPPSSRFADSAGRTEPRQPPSARPWRARDVTAVRLSCTKGNMAVAGPPRLLSLAARFLLAPRRDLAVRGPDEPLPVVRIPRALLRRQEQRQSPPRPVLVRPGPLLISARRPELNQPARLTLGRWERAPLASRGWKNRRARQDHFSIERAQQEAPALRNLSSEDSFAHLGLEPRVLRALQEAAPEVVRPTTVQSSTIPSLLRGRHILCAAETGSGKTLSYLLPLLQLLLGRPRLDSHRIPAPRGLVLVPSRELAEQVQAVAQPLGSSLDLQVRELGGGHGMSRIKLQLSKQPPADVLVATPGALWKALKRQLISLEQLSFLVLDEADTLLDESFLELKGSRDILLCTDIASRGLDSTHVELVVNYDFPLTLQDYIHRAGRVGRVGSEVPGTVISFVTHPWDVSLVQKIELAARRRRSLPGLGSSVREPLPQQT
ncbi:hypothetical protein HPG69_000255 [Diceros bicornis minor]|uniref:RNA helicase n=1 Tax=Diceros bicornis minor TaxID=77932 RepID=A0A7J7EVN8_DICBM|nr:hypothetical protein HPG69_000255 [Diceros bicornis minor]